MTPDPIPAALAELHKARTMVLAAMGTTKQPVARGNMAAALAHLDRATKTLEGAGAEVPSPEGSPG